MPICRMTAQENASKSLFRRMPPPVPYRLAVACLMSAGCAQSWIRSDLIGGSASKLRALSPADNPVAIGSTGLGLETQSESARESRIVEHGAGLTVSRDAAAIEQDQSVAEAQRQVEIVHDDDGEPLPGIGMEPS